MYFLLRIGGNRQQNSIAGEHIVLQILLALVIPMSTYDHT